jgi:flagellar basal body rod protein FlgG
MQTASARFNASAEAISRGEVEAAQAVELIESKRAFEANAVAAKSADQTLGTLIDALA